VIVLNDDIAGRLTEQVIAAVVRHESAELARRERRYRSGRPALALDGRVTLLVDDGLATGATARAAVEVARGLGAARVVVAVPVGSPIAVGEVGKVADDVVCPLQPDGFGSVSRWYERFPQVTDAEVARLLA
jgi:predicted phosphoribosyltransferase